MNQPTSDHRPLAIALMGPTASGKTALAVDWARQLDTRIVSVDSALVYRGLDIGSAKPVPGGAEYALHRLVDIRDPHQPYSAAEFAKDALREMQVLADTGKIPILAGGTGLYFKALLEGLSDMPEADAATRAELEREAAAVGWPAMHSRLAEVDAVAAARIHPNDPQRILRALEVHRLSGRAISEWRQEAVRQPFPFRVLELAIAPKDRSVLHQRIEQRFDAMLQAGFLDEMRRLMADPRLHPDLPAMRAVGYRQAWQHLAGALDFPGFREQAIAATRQLAKRQLTWLRARPELRWLDPATQSDELSQTLHAFTRR